MFVQFLSLTFWGNEFVNEYYPYPAPLIFVLGSLSLLCVCVPILLKNKNRGFSLPPRPVSDPC